MFTPFFGLVWATSWVSGFLPFNHLFKVPDYLVSIFPSKVFSVVNSPIELPTPLFLTPPHSKVWSSNSSVAALGNLTFQTSASTAQMPAFTRPSVPVAAVANSFCYSELEQNKDLQIASISASSSRLWNEYPRNQTKSSFSQQLWQVVQNLLPWRQRVASSQENLAASVVVVSTHSSPSMADKHNSEVKSVKQGFLQYSQRLKKHFRGDSSGQEQFQVWVKNHLIAHFPKPQTAELLAQRLKQLLSKPSDPALDNLSVKATLSQGLPTVKIGDHLLLQVDETLAKALNKNPELLAIEWVNNLRIAFGKKPLPLAEAQRQMHNLVETSKTFQGKASWYGHSFHGLQTATGETYNQHELTAAHPTLPFDTFLKVKNRKNGHSVIVRINDRGPYVPDRSLDLSKEAARCLNSEKAGIVPFEAVIMQPSSRPLNPYLSRN